MNYRERTDLDNWLMSYPDPGEEVECPDCGGECQCTGCQIGDAKAMRCEEEACDFCLGEGTVSEDALRMRDYERAEAERAEEWRKDMGGF